MARAYLRQSHTSIFISYNQEDSKEKIVYVKQLHEELPLAIQKKLEPDRKTELGFSSKGKTASISRIFSYPCRAPRGKHGTIYLDELAHYQDDRKIFVGSTAVIVRESDQLTGCSTPLGQRGIFYEVARPTNAQNWQKYKHYWRQSVPWWRSTYACLNVAEAVKYAPTISTEDRVERFGSRAMQEQLDLLGVDDFQQEFECAFIDEKASFFPYDLILPCTDDSLDLCPDFSYLPRPRGRYVAGFDVGRRHDLSELVVFDEVFINGRRELTCVLSKTYDNLPFEEQEKDIRRFLETVPVSRLYIDEVAIGMNIAENLQRKSLAVKPFKMSMQSKEVIATDLKWLLQQQAVHFPRHRKILGQLHGIRKRVTEIGNTVFEAERSKGEHGDLAWAIMMACQKDRLPPSPTTPTVGFRVFE